MHFAKGLSICEGACYACIAHLGPKASEQKEREKVDPCLRRRAGKNLNSIEH